LKKFLEAVILKKLSTNLGICFFPLLIAGAFFVQSCAVQARPYYNRSKGAYTSVPSTQRFSSASTGLGSSTESRKNQSGKIHSGYPVNQASVAPPYPTESGSTERPRGSLYQVAHSYLGVPYKYGGSSSRGMDCSGFVTTVYREVFGIKLPRSSHAMKYWGKKVDLDDLQEGDVLLFGRFFGFINHSGVYYADGKFFHASSSNGVELASIHDPYYKERLCCARRP